MTTASAPGKIILFGEHAVVYHRPALAVPVTQVHADVEITDSRQADIWIDAPAISLSASIASLPSGHALRRVVEAVFELLNITNPPALKIHVTTSIPVASGMGSGAAVSVAFIRALSTHLGSLLGDEQVNKLCYEIEKIYHGTPSGIDNTVITYARPVYFIKDQSIETFQVKSAFKIVIADTGKQAPTREAVEDVRKLWVADPQRWNEVFENIKKIVQRARQDIENGAWLELGPLMDANHAFLQEMSVSSAELDRLVLEAKKAGAEGAKMSGGGRGGNMIALVRSEIAEEVASALQAAGAKHTIITTVK